MPGKDRYAEFGKLNVNDTVLGRYQDYEAMDAYAVEILQDPPPHPLEQLAAEAPGGLRERWEAFMEWFFGGR